MTWDHLQQLRAAAQGRIQQGLAELQPQGGNGVMVSGNAISVQGGGGALPVRRVSWSTIVYATVTQRYYPNEGYEEGGPFEWKDKPVEVAHFIDSDEPSSIGEIRGLAHEYYPVPYAYGRDGIYKSEFEVHFEALSYPRYSDNGRRLNGDPTYEQRFFRFPVRLELETFYMIYIEDGPWGVKEIPVEQSVRVGAGGVTVQVKPTTMIWPHRLRITEAKRL